MAPAALDPEALRSPRARQFAAYLVVLDSPFARLTGLSVEPGFDLLDLEVMVERPRDLAQDIREVEPLRLSFAVDDGCAPDAYSLRDDFPKDLPHTTHGLAGEPRSLCLWEEPWVELRRRLTAEALLSELRTWLAKTAAGDLHAPGQALEPMLPATRHTVILPVGGARRGQTLHIVRAQTVVTDQVLELAAEPPPDRVNAGVAVMIVELPETPHGALHGFPSSLASLLAFVKARGFDLAASLKAELLRHQTSQALTQHLLIILLIPKSPGPGEPAREMEVRGLMTADPIAVVGERMGVLMVHAGPPAMVAQAIGGAAGDLSKTYLMPWRIVERLSRRYAAALSGGVVDDRRILAVGAGALGSQLISIAARSAFGRWSLLDKDLVLPHNTVRQGQGDWAVGHSKVASLEHLANHLLAEPAVERVFELDVLSRTEAIRDQVDGAMAESDLVVDLSASPAVLGRLADGPGDGRRASLFFSPDGADLVLMLEDADRAVRLDGLEAQYYAAVASDTALAGHLDAARIGAVRYSNACQDVSRPLPPWRVASLSALGAAQLQTAANNPAARLSVWRTDEGGGVRRSDHALSTLHTVQAGGWRITLAETVLAGLRAERAAALPSETGGVLLGVADLDRSVLHLVDALPAPPDSRRTPSYFERGVKGLRLAVEDRQRKTAGHLDYVGEWHAHPRGVAASPSGEDEVVFAHLRKVLGAPGRPYLMAILGDDRLWLRFAFGLSPPEEAVINL
jgi:hypothetical protein